MDQSAGMSNVNKEDVRTHAELRGVVSRDIALSPTYKRKAKKRRLSGQKKFQKHYHNRKLSIQKDPPVLRPAGTQVPRAPENSTQFIMDNHEESNLFFNFEGGSSDNVYDGTCIADFEEDYKNVKEEILLNCSVDHLRKAIMAAESKCAKLQNIINSRPSVILNDLQNVLLRLQEENARLKQKRVSTNSSSDSQSSSSSFSGSESGSDSCSDSNCSKCFSDSNYEENKQDRNFNEFYQSLPDKDNG